MAEARQAVGFQFSVTQDGHLNIDYDQEVIKLILHAGQRAYKKSLARFLNRLKNGIFPVGPEIIAGYAVVLTGFHLVGIDVTFGITKTIVNGLNV